MPGRGASSDKFSSSASASSMAATNAKAATLSFARVQMKPKQFTTKPVVLEIVKEYKRRMHTLKLKKAAKSAVKSPVTSHSKSAVISPAVGESEPEVHADSTGDYVKQSKMDGIP